MLRPGRKAWPAGSIRSWFEIDVPRRRANSLLMILPIMGLTEMGRITSTEDIWPSFLGRAVTMVCFSFAGMSLERKDSLTIFLRSSMDRVGWWVTVWVGKIGVSWMTPWADSTARWFFSRLSSRLDFVTFGVSQGVEEAILTRRMARVVAAALLSRLEMVVLSSAVEGAMRRSLRRGLGGWIV